MTCLHCNFYTKSHICSLFNTLKFFSAFQNCAVVVQSLAFKEGLIGEQEISFKYKDLKEYVKVEVQAGPPAGISLPGWDLEQV